MQSLDRSGSLMNRRSDTGKISIEIPSDVKHIREVSLGILIAALRALEARQALPSAATQSNSAQQPTGAPDSE